MSVIDRYVFRIATTAFLSALFALTGVVWVTQALREFDLMTAKGQTLWVFLTVTGLALPALIAVIAPVALFVAIVYTLNKLNGDSELIVLSASGCGPVRVMRPLMALTLIVAALSGVLSVSAIPGALRTLRVYLTEIQADVLANIVREGAFTTLDNGLTFHIRARAPGGILLGLFVEDGRDPKQSLTYIAETGRVAEEGDKTVLVLEKGTVQRRAPGDSDANIVVFDRYAFDLSPLTNTPAEIYYKPKERYLAELLAPPPDDPVYQALPGRFRSELHERLVTPFYPVAFMVLAYAALGRPRTTRQSRFSGLMIATLLVGGARMIGLGASNLVASTPLAVPFVYAVPVGATLGALAWIFGLDVWFAERFAARRRRRPRLEPAVA